MKLTKKQEEVLNRYKELEKEYGKGNVFIRYLNDYWKACFIIHKIGEDKYTFFYKDEDRINKTILNSLEKKGLLTCCDNNHNEDIDPNLYRNPNSWKDSSKEWFCVGSRIKTELL